MQHAAEREFYRDAVRAAATRKGIATEIVIEKDLPKLAERLPGTEASRRETLSAYGKLAGIPLGTGREIRGHRGLARPRPATIALIFEVQVRVAKACKTTNGKLD